MSKARQASEITEDLLAQNHFATLTDTREILRYSEGIYVANAQSYITKLIERNVPPEEITNNLCSEVLGHVERSTFVERGVFQEHDNPHIVLQNGLLNLSDVILGNLLYSIPEPRARRNTRFQISF